MNIFSYKTLLYAVIFTVTFVLLPFAFASIVQNTPPDSEKKASSAQHSKAAIQKLQLPQKTRVYRTETGETQSVNFEEYICGVVAGEVPDTFHIEALKAQAVAARTYAAAKLSAEKPAHSSAPLCDSTHCQVYKTPAQLKKEKGSDWMNSGYRKICSAVKATKGQVMYYDGKPAGHTFFHSSSGGFTENCSDVFAESIPYLVSVESPYEDDATHKNETYTFSYDRLQSMLSAAYPRLHFGSLNSSNLRIIRVNEGGSVGKMQLGEVILTGQEVRSALHLFSADFSIDPQKSKVVFTSSGSGHGVGMSQYGANGMAKKGYNYRQILKHYYKGIEIE